MPLNVVKAQGLAIAYTDADGKVYPLACAKDTSITINREMIELAPKSAGSYRSYIPGRKSFTISGTGLVKMRLQNGEQGIDFFDDMFTSSVTRYVAYLDIISEENIYAIYKFHCYITDLTLDRTVNGYANYSYTLQGDGDFTPITETDEVMVGYDVSGLISARDPSQWQLIGLSYLGKWYFNYTVLPIDGAFWIDIGPLYEYQDVITVYKPI